MRKAIQWAAVCTAASALACGGTKGSGASDAGLSVKYSSADLAGTWETHSLASGPGISGWIRGETMFVPDGAFKWTSVDSQGQARSGSGMATVSRDGTVTLAGDESFQGLIDAGKSVLVGTETWDDGTMELRVAVKRAAAYSLSDLVGRWEANGLAFGPGLARWIRAEMTVASDGTFSGGTVDSSGVAGSTSGSLAISADGVVTAAGKSSWLGVLDEDRSVLVATDTLDDGTKELQVLVKAVGTYSLSDLAGEWRGASFWAGSGGVRWWDRNESKCTPNGTCKGTSTPVVGPTSSVRGTFTMSPGGICDVTYYEIDGVPVPGLPARFGVLDAGRSAFASTLGPDLQGNVDLRVVLKVR